MGKELTKKVMFPPAGKYILAVSGGLDSVCLLDILFKHPGHELIVAHFDHGLRANSHKDAELVKSLAKKYKLKFASHSGKLPPNSTEATARRARYQFLFRLQKKCAADNIITAHHLDDALETAIFNTGRGAEGWGLTPMHLASTPLRPLLGIRKSELLTYGQAQKLKWREDPTNQNLSLARNLIRHKILPNLTLAEVEQFKKLASKNLMAHNRLQGWLEKHAISAKTSISLKRADFTVLRFDDSKLISRLMVKQLGGALETAQLERLVIFLKTAAPGRGLDMGGKLRAVVTDDMITLVKKAPQGPVKYL